MAETRINGRNGTADVSINAVTYATRFRRFSLVSNVPQIDVTTFSTETAPVHEPGVEIIRFDVAGFLTYNATNAGPLIPAPQNVPLVFTYFTGCTISFTGSFESASADRQVGTHSIMTGSGVSAGAITVTWDLS